VLLQWVNGLGTADVCFSCAKLSTADIQMRPDLGWIESESVLGKGLSAALLRVHRNRTSGQQFFISQLVPGVGNPVFRELAYKDVQFPDAGFQMIALFRYWNIIQYWFPYRDVLEENWDQVLSEFVPRLALAKDFKSYQLELMSLIARAHDTHSNLWSSLQVRPPVGVCQLAVALRFVESQPVVAGYTTAASSSEPLKVGDVLLELDGTSLRSLIAEWTPYYADSNDAARQRDLAWSMTGCNCGEATVRVNRDGDSLEIRTRRVRAVAPRITHDLAGDTFRLLSKDVAYLKLSSVKAADVGRYIDSAAGTKGLIIDIRNYPSEFVVFALGSLLVDHETPFTRFTIGDLSNPGEFHWQGAPLTLRPLKPHYSGRVVILVDETTQSQAEYTTMAFRASSNATVIGSITAGADGNVSEFSVPGGLRSMISGIGVFYPDKRPTQRVGIIPDHTVRPTIAGIRAGRDEVLESALREILGPDAAGERIREVYKH